MKRIFPIFLTALVVLLVGCTQKYAYTNIIPKDASMVVSIDFKQLYEKSNIDKSKKGKDLKSYIENVIKDFFSDMDEEEINAILQNPNESGIEFTEKGYLFIGRESNTYGLVFKVSDKKKILQFDTPENQISFKKEQDLYTCTTSDFIIMFDDSALLVLSSEYPSDESLRQYAFSLMKENKEKGTPAELTSLFAKQADIAAYFDLNFIPDRLLASARMGMSGDLLLKDLKFITSVNLEKGKISVLLDNITENPILVDLFEQYGKAFSPMSDKFLEMFPINSLIYVGTHLDGSTFHRLIQENPAISYALTNSEIPIDLNRALSAIRGDLTIGIQSLTDRTFSLYAEVNDTFLQETLNELQTFVSTAQGMASIQKVKDNFYLFQAYPDLKIWFGGYRNIFFLTNNSYCATYFGEAHKLSLKQKQWASNVYGHAISGAIDVSRLLKDVDILPYDQTGTMLRPFEYIQFDAKDWKQLQIDVITENKGKNILEQLIDLVSNFK